MPNLKDLLTSAPCADDRIDEMDTRIIELEDTLDRCNRFLADLNGCEWIKGGDAGSIDMRQRAKNTHRMVSSMLGDRATGENDGTASLMHRLGSLESLATGLQVDPATAAIKYAIEHPCDSPVEFLHAWYYGNFDAIRREWDDVPEEVFIGADPLRPEG